MTAEPQPADPILLPGATMAGVTETVCRTPLADRIGIWWWIAMAVAALLDLCFVVGVAWLFLEGVGIWGNNRPVMWGFPIINYVWWIGIASGGTIISSLFFLMRQDWRSSINRIAETMTLFAAACAGIYPVLHLGRPWFFYWLFPYPNTMGLWPQFRSPLLWDFFAVLTYVVSSVLFWYVGLLPDLASLRDRATTRGRQLVYGLAALGWRGSARQWQSFRIGYALLAALMAPLVMSVHSIVGLDFAGGLAPGWHSTQFPPFFVFGAVLSGFAMVLLLVIPARRLFGFEQFITPRHFDVLAKLLLTASLAVGYAYAMEAFMAFYDGPGAEQTEFLDRLGGVYAPIYWTTILCNVLLPQLLWSPRLRRAQPVLMLLSVLIIIGMWCERFLIVAAPHRDFLATTWRDYFPTAWDWILMAGTVGIFFTGLLLCARWVPLASMFELRELIGRRAEGAE